VANILMGTTYVAEDEPCYFLAENNEPAPDSRGFRRYQTVTVMRGDKKAILRRDLGPAESFKTEPFQIPGGATDPVTGKVYIEETVGSLLAIANHLREGPFERPEPPKPHDLAGAYKNQYEHRRKIRLRQSTIGHGGVTQRS
jgi:hypothetical protein